MNIAQVNLQKDWGGAEKHVSLLSRSLREADHSVIVCSHPQGRLRRDVESHGIRCLPITAINQLDLMAGVKLAVRLARFRPDILHVHTPRDYISGLLASRFLPGSALVLTRHMMLPLKPMMRRLYAQTRGVFCLSAGMRLFLQTQGVPLSLLHHVRSGIDTALFSAAALAQRETIRREWKLAPEEIAVGVVGRLVPGKGHSLLLEALSRLRKAEFQEDVPVVKCVFVGEGQERERLSRQAHALGLSDYVFFTGFRNDIPATLGALDVFTLPSQSELLPLSIMEAMAAGLPVLATEVGSLTELIESEVSGLLTPPDDPEKLAVALRRLTADAALRAKLGACAAERAHTDFTLEAMARETIGAYRLILTAQGRT